MIARIKKLLGYKIKFYGRRIYMILQDKKIDEVLANEKQKDFWEILENLSREYTSETQN